MKIFLNNSHAGNIVKVVISRLMFRQYKNWNEKNIEVFKFYQDTRELLTTPLEALSVTIHLDLYIWRQINSSYVADANSYLVYKYNWMYIWKFWFSYPSLGRNNHWH